MSTCEFENVPVVWTPSKVVVEKIEAIWRRISEKYNVKIENYWDMHKWSVENLEIFWSEVWEVMEIIYSKTYESIIDVHADMGDSPEWFPGARLNFAENLLKYRDDKIAVIGTGEDRETSRITYAELYQECSHYGAALRKLGVKKNDNVACYISNREEPIFVLIAATSIGAIWSGSLPLLGAKAVLSRLQLIKPKILFTVDRFLYNGVEYEMLDRIKEIADGLTSLEKVVIVPSKPGSCYKNISEIRNSCWLDEFLRLGEDAAGNVPDLEFEQVPLNHPIFISCTSGSTGTPKALLHGSGVLLSASRDVYFNGGNNRNKNILSTSPVGWGSWNIFATRLAFGVTLTLYEGLPYFLHPTAAWDLVDEFNINEMFITPGELDEMEKGGYVPNERNHLSSLAHIRSGASVVKPQNYDFVYGKIKRDIIFGSIYGCTEFMGSAMLINPTLPIHKGEITAPCLGMNVCCYDDMGNSVVGEYGELVITTPSPSMPTGMLGDETGEVYRKQYFEKYPGVFTIGDLAYINPVTRGLVVIGRSDNTLKPKGSRFGSSEIYTVVDTFPEIMDSLCVPHYNKGDERVVLFLKMRNHHVFTQDLVHRICATIDKELTEDHVPEVILECPAIPYNITGKKMESTVKKIINNRPYDAQTVMDSSCLKFYENIPEFRSSEGLKNP